MKNNVFIIKQNKRKRRKLNFFEKLRALRKKYDTKTLSCIEDNIHVTMQKMQKIPSPTQS